MQALFLLVFYGFFFAVIASMMQINGLSALDLKQRQIEGTQKFFRDIETTINQSIVRSEMTAPQLGTNIENYLQYNNLKTKINWNLSKSTTLDPWLNNFTGFVLHKREAIMAQQGGGVLHVPVTAFLLVSAGPDRQLSDAVATHLASLSTSSEIRDVTRIDVPADSDDIVHAFATHLSQVAKWEVIKQHADGIAEAILQRINADQKAFVLELKRVYGDNYTDFYNGVGQIVLTPENEASWVNDGVIAQPPNMSLLEDAASIYANDKLEAIEQQNLQIRLKSYDVLGTPADNIQCLGSAAGQTSYKMRLCLVNNGSPWGDSGGNLFYYQDIVADQIYE